MVEQNNRFKFGEIEERGENVAARTRSARPIQTPTELFDRHIVKESYVNVQQIFITTTEDRLRICLGNHLKRLESKREWMVPAGIFLTLLITLTTTDTKDFISVNASTWQAIYIISTILSFIWLTVSLRNAFLHASLEDILVELKTIVN